MSSFFHRSKPSKIISARWAKPCGHWRERESVRRTSCCRSVMIIFVAFPGMAGPSTSLVIYVTQIRCQIPVILGSPFQPGCTSLVAELEAQRAPGQRMSSYYLEVDG